MSEPPNPFQAAIERAMQERTRKLNESKDKWGKTVAEVTAAWQSLSDEAREVVQERAKYHTERLIYVLGFPQTGADAEEMVASITKVCIGVLILDGYLQTTDKGFSISVENMKLFEDGD